MRRWRCPSPFFAARPAACVLGAGALLACSSGSAAPSAADPPATSTADGGGATRTNDGADGAAGADAAVGASASAADAAMPDAGAPSLAQANGDYVLTMGDLSVTIDPQVGGRVIDLTFRGQEWLTGPGADATNYGSTFWTSPQSDWNWPPPPPIDNAPYQATADGTTLVLQGAKSPALGVAVTKRFAMDPASGALLIDYRVTNDGSSARSLAPWEVTRVTPSGLFFFPSAGAGYSADSGAALPVEQAAGAGWYAYDTATIPDSIKYFAQPSGAWLAQLRGGTVFAKKFSSGAAAPGESPVEIFLAGDHAYVELEAQGGYQALAAGASLDWNVRWVVRDVPPGVEATEGSASLVAFVNGL